MPLEDDLNDDYVAKLLAADAKRTSSKYATQGLSAFLPRQNRAADAPKPNTRFLNNIVREADSHNAALKRKEELEARRRLRALRETVEPPAKRRRVDESDGSKRSRMFKDILGAARPERSHKSNSDTHGDRARDRRHDRPDHRRSEADSRRPRSLSRSRSPRKERRHRRRRSRESDHESDQVKQKSHDSDRDELPAGGLDTVDSHDHARTQDSVQVRGRGANKHRSAMDDHFRKDYDPTQDVSLDSDGGKSDEDWDLALEAMRDRAAYKKNQLSRMREAGFSDQDISKWETNVLDTGGADGDVHAVRWKRKGEIRDWDAGKS